MTHTVLIIDSNPAQRNMLYATLKEKLAYDVTSVASGREAINLAMAHPPIKPDIILYDVAEVASACEAIAGLNVIVKNTPIIALVNYGDYEAAMALVAAGGHDFLIKPVAVERLSTTFRNCLRLRDTQREMEYMRRETINDTPVFGDFMGHNPMLPFSWIAEDGNVRRMEQIEAEAIRFAMQYYNGRMTEVARRLGIGRSTLYRKLSEMNVRGTAGGLPRQKQTEAA